METKVFWIDAHRSIHSLYNDRAFRNLKGWLVSPESLMLSLQSRYSRLLLIALLSSASAVAAPDRIVTPVNPLRTAVLSGKVDPRAQAANDRGLVDPATPLDYVTLLLKPSGDISRVHPRTAGPGVGELPSLADPGAVCGAVRPLAARISRS
jgi:hypothetical protein